MIVEKNLNGSWSIYEDVNGYFFKRLFFFCTKREAISRFTAERNYLISRGEI